MLRGEDGGGKEGRSRTREEEGSRGSNRSRRTLYAVERVRPKTQAVHCQVAIAT